MTLVKASLPLTEDGAFRHSTGILST